VSEQARIMVIRCPGCRKRIFRYLKVGKGRLIRCLKERIREDHSIRNGPEVLCVCGRRIGRDEGDSIKILGSFRLD
jgi:hypothetical protein